MNVLRPVRDWIRCRPAASRIADANHVSSWSGPLLPILAVGFAAALRLWHVGQQSLWVDEFGSLTTAMKPLAQIPAQALQHDAFEPPLYFWLLHGVISVGGASEWALRIPSVIAGILTVPVIWLLVRAVNDSDRIANIAALLLATSPLHIWYSQEARPYALLLCLGSSALFCLTRALRAEHIGWWVGFSVLSALAVLTHVTGVIYPFLGGLWALHILGARAFRPVALAAAGTFALTLPFLLSLADAVRYAAGTGSPPRPLTGLELSYSLYTFLAGYSFGPPVREIQDLGWRAAVANHSVQTVLVIAILLWLTVLVLRVQQPVFQLAVLLGVPLATAIVGSLISAKAYNVRYVLPGIVGFYGLVAVALGRLTGWAFGLGLGSVLALSLWADAQWFGSPAYGKEDTRGAAACLIRQLAPGSTVAVVPPYMRDLLSHYAPESAGLKFISVADSAGVEESMPNALAVTRLYHLPVAEANLVRAFQAQAGGQLLMGREVGYRLYFASTLSGQATASPCQL